MSNKLLDIVIPSESKKDILEKIKKYISQPEGFFHIVSLNPENLVVAHERHDFRKVLNEAQIKIADGMGVVMASRLLNHEAVEKIAGIDLMISLLKVANERRLRVMLIGGGPKIADQVVNCQERRFPEVKFYSLEGFKDIKNQRREEEEKIFSIVADTRPHFLFVAFGSPEQELWLYEYKDRLDNLISMGVGGAFDFLSARVPRAPLWLRQIGLEWLFRLIIQPWRISRQMRLLKFIWLVLKEKMLKSGF